LRNDPLAEGRRLVVVEDEEEGTEGGGELGRYRIYDTSRVEIESSCSSR
jgi:hypothetical protein